MKWEKRLYHPIPVLPSYYICIGFRDKAVPTLGTSFDNFKNINGHMYIGTEMLQRFTEHLRQRLDEDENYAKRLLEEVDYKSQKLIQTANRISKENLRSCSRLELVELLQEYVDAFTDLTPFLPATNVCIAIFEGMLRKELEQRLDDHELIEEYLLVLTSPTEYTDFGHFYKELLKLAIALREDSKCTNDLQASNNLLETEKALRHLCRNIFVGITCLVETYCWLSLDFGFGTVITFEDILERLRGLVRFDPRQKLQDLLTHRDELQRKQRQVIENHLPDKMVITAELLQKFILTRQARFEAFNRSGVEIKTLFEEIAKRLKLSSEEIEFLLPAEITEVLERTRQVDNELRATIKKRQSRYAMILEKGEIELYSDTEVKFVAEEEEAIPTVSEVRGKVASKGIVIGRASIVLNSSEFQKVQEGDVLVTTASTPEYGPILDKISAIVTDVGGITSHAAIVSREMGIPSVVSTKIGTRVFKDGDILEVDANRGIVKKMQLFESGTGG